jgi:hypothetical protein
MASVSPLGQEARPLCMVLMVGGSPVPSTLGHRGEKVPDVLQALLGKWVGWYPWDSVTFMLQRRGRSLPDDEGPVQLALVVSFAGGGAPLLLLGIPVRHLLPSHLLGRRDVGGSSTGMSWTRFITCMTVCVNMREASKKAAHGARGARDARLACEKLAARSCKKCAKSVRAARRRLARKLRDCEKLSRDAATTLLKDDVFAQLAWKGFAKFVCSTCQGFCKVCKLCN